MQSVIIGDGQATLYCADCLEILPTFAAGSVDAVVTDPPYLVNVNSSVGGKANPWADIVNGSFWFREWMTHCKRGTANGGCMWSFLNWKSIPIYQKAALDCEWKIESMLVWDKGYPGTGGIVGLRPTYEMVALFAGDNFSIKDRSVGDIKHCKWQTTKPTGHPAEKPVALMEWLIDISQPKEVVLDPFMGSGTTGVAALKKGKRFIGIEVDQHYFEIACERIRREAQQLKLF